MERVALFEERVNQIPTCIGVGRGTLAERKERGESPDGIRVAESVGKVDNEAAKRLGEVWSTPRPASPAPCRCPPPSLAAIGSTRRLPFSPARFGPVRAILQHLREKNLLPADVSEGFVGRLLKRGEMYLWLRSNTRHAPSRKRGAIPHFLAIHRIELGPLPTLHPP